jgi:hypothetical protein
MKKIMIASMREGAGKTSIIVGLTAAVKKNYAYLKPIGDRLIYRRKKNIDHDANLLVDLLKLEEDSESITLGFDHAKLRHIYDETKIKEALTDRIDHLGKSRDTLIIEGGRDLTYGASIHLDSISVSKMLNAGLIIVVSGESDTVIDDIQFIKEYINTFDADFKGIIINKVKDIEDFRLQFGKAIKDTGIKLFGIIPYQCELTFFNISFLAEKLFAKVLAGESGLKNIVKNIFVGAMSTQESLRNPLFNKESKLLITSGDRSDMILSALDDKTAGILLTNNIIPPSNIISIADEKNIPLLAVNMDTYQVTQIIDDIVPLIAKDDAQNIAILKQLIEKCVDYKDIV